ncbi:MAG TPA: L-histidine N(alpha)-methyltransferase [Pseudonocardiaceae bacterium]
MTIEVHLTAADAAAALRADVLAGLTASPKWLPPKWFYDARGSELFELITALPEYYPTRAERAVLAVRAGEFAAVARDAGVGTLVELGSGSSDKTRLLLDALRAAGTLRRFVPLDVSESALAASTEALAAAYPGLVVHGVVGDFTRHLELLPTGEGTAVAFLGGTIGNFVPEERAEFFGGLRKVLPAGSMLLLGVDLVKPESVLVPAYDDARGVTAEFNRNVLRVLNRELGADFDVEAFEHVALWDPAREWIEMRLRATRPMTVRVAGLDLDVAFAAGEELRTEVSAKFRREGVTAELADAGFRLERWWTDPAGRFAVALATAA